MIGVQGMRFADWVAEFKVQGVEFGGLKVRVSSLGIIGRG